MLTKALHRSSIINVCCYILLAFYLRKADAHHTWDNCHCVPLKSCHILNDRIERSSNFNEIKLLIKNSLCHFDGFHISVCCPKPLYSAPNHALAQHAQLNYIDEVTGLNDPRSFSDEYDYNNYLRKKGFGNVSNCNERTPITTATATATTTTTTAIPSVNILPKPDNNACGVLINNITDQTLYPWIVRLAYLNTTRRTIRYRCMGSIIDDRHILTAAHCVSNLVPNLQLIYVRIGDDNNYKDYEIEATIVHPNYNDPLFNNDVALLKLITSSEEQFTKICLPENVSQTLMSSNGLVAGWNASNNSSSNVSSIRYINLSLLNNTECAIRYAQYSENFVNSIVITPTEFCAQTQTFSDVCEGDSGGPFMSMENSTQYTIIGIVAFGPKTNCGESNLPGVYMRVSSYIDWIKDVLGRR